MQKYSKLMRINHWLLAALFIGNLIIGLYMPQIAKVVSGTYPLHKSLGVVILLYAIFRVAVRLRSKLPEKIGGIPAWQELAAKATHFLLYAALLAMPLSGYIMSNARGKTVEMFGILMPTLVEKNKPLAKLAYEAHEIGANVAIVLIALHVGAVVVHYVLHKTNLLKRIW